jgi:hypothetical protein
VYEIFKSVLCDVSATAELESRELVR